MKKNTLSIVFTGLFGLGISLTPLHAQTGPVVVPIENDTANQLETFYSQNGGRSQFPQITQDVAQAFLAAEDAVVAGDFATARVLIDEIIAQYPFTSAAWSGATFPTGLNLGRPAGYYGIRMLDEITRQGLANQGKKSQPLTLTIVTVDCAVGFQPTNTERTETREVSHTINPLIEDNDYFVLRQGAQLLQQYMHALTSGEQHLQLRFVTEEETCAAVSSPRPTGRWIGLNNTAALLNNLSDAVKDSSDMYWLVYPSNIPEDPEFTGFEFISSATNRFEERMVFMMDDRWILKKPLHLGTGDTSEIERRLYHPQWMQHEYFHHLFLREFPEFELEKTSHQWFSATNWPADFTRPPGREADYYAEAVNKRFYDASPSVSERFNYSKFANKPVKLYTGSNYSDLAWGLAQGTHGFGDVRQSPVGNDAISSIEIAQGYLVELCEHSAGGGACKTYSTSTPQIEGLLNNGASHIEVKTVSSLNVAGQYVRSPILNNWHYVTLEQTADKIWWTNRAGIRCELSWSNGTKLMASSSCPYGEREIDVVVNQDGGIAAIKILNETYTRQGEQAITVVTDRSANEITDAESGGNSGGGTFDSLKFLLVIFGGASLWLRRKAIKNKITRRFAK